MTHSKDNHNKVSRVNRNWPQDGPDVGFSKDFKEIIINMFKNLKEYVFKELKENMVIMSEVMGNEAQKYAAGKGI